MNIEIENVKNLRRFVRRFHDDLPVLVRLPSGECMKITGANVTQVEGQSSPMGPYDFECLVLNVENSNYRESFCY